jgi:hypothetical protein
MTPHEIAAALPASDHAAALTAYRDALAVLLFEIQSEMQRIDTGAAPVGRWAGAAIVATRKYLLTKEG